MSKKFHDQSLEVKEALLGEYSAQVTPLGNRPIKTGHQIAMVLEHGEAALSAIAKKYRLNTSDTLQLSNHLEGLDYYTELRLESDEGRAAIKAGSDAILMYNNKFKDATDSLTDGDALRAGGYSDTFLFTLGGDSYVARHGIDGRFGAVRTNIEEVNKHFEASIRVLHPTVLPYLEQVQAVSYTDDTTIAPYVPGNRFLQAALADQLGPITDSHVAAMYHSMKLGEQRGIMFDGFGANLILGPDGKLTWIDLGVKGIYGITDSNPESALYRQLENVLTYSKSKNVVKKLARVASICIDIAPQYDTPAGQRKKLTDLYALAK